MKQLFLLTLALIVPSVTQAQSDDVVLDEIIAIVNDGVVLNSEIAAEAAFLISQAKAGRQSLPDDAVLAERVRERLIIQEIQSQRARELGIEIDEASVNQAIEQVASNNKLNTFEFRKALRDEGLNYEHYRATIRHELLLNRLIQREVEQSINVSEQEIDDYLTARSAPNSENQRYNLRHLLIAEPSTSSAQKIEQARLKAAGLVARLNNGADFAQLAVTESDGPRALQGGDLGWLKIHELPLFLREQVTTLEPGEVSAPIQSPDGFHIIRIDGVRIGDQDEVIETRARHIYINTAGDDADSADVAQEKLRGIRARLLAGEAFAGLAEEFSDDPNSAGNGGELPWFSEGQLPPELEQQALALAPGQISEPFPTQYGWHLLEVLERRDAALSDTRRRRDAELDLRNRKLEQETERWSRRMRSEAFVEILKP